MVCKQQSSEDNVVDVGLFCLCRASYCTTIRLYDSITARTEAEPVRQFAVIIIVAVKTIFSSYTSPVPLSIHCIGIKKKIQWNESFPSNLSFCFFLELDWRLPTGSVIKAGNQTDYTELLLLLLLSDSAENICFPSPLPCYQGSFSRYVLVLRSKKWLYGCYTLIVTFVQILIKWLPCNHLLS